MLEVKREGIITKRHNLIELISVHSLVLRYSEFQKPQMKLKK